MKILIVLSIAGMLLAAPATLPAGIPANAVQISPNAYRATRPDGTTWIYHITPFGITSAEQTGVKATADGDTVRFERATPVGIIRWQKKKSDLNKMEQAVWERDSAVRGAAQE